MPEHYLFCNGWFDVSNPGSDECSWLQLQPIHLCGAAAHARNVPAIAGDVVKALGKVSTMLLGFCILLLGAGLYLAGSSFAIFLSGITLVGVGWNLSFVPATALLTSFYRPAEKATVQAFNDLLVIGLLAVAMASSGAFVVRLILLHILCENNPVADQTPFPA